MFLLALDRACRAVVRSTKVRQSELCNHDWRRSQAIRSAKMAYFGGKGDADQRSKHRSRSDWIWLQLRRNFNAIQIGRCIGVGARIDILSGSYPKLPTAITHRNSSIAEPLEESILERRGQILKSPIPTEMRFLGNCHRRLVVTITVMEKRLVGLP